MIETSDRWIGGPRRDRRDDGQDRHRAGHPGPRREIEEALGGLGRLYPIPEPEFRLLPKRIGPRRWKAHYPVLTLGRQTVIVPRWMEYQRHPRRRSSSSIPAWPSAPHAPPNPPVHTRWKTASPDLRVPDMGTGPASCRSGRWSRAQARCWPDVDELAVAVARENMAANHVGCMVRVEAGPPNRPGPVRPDPDQHPDRRHLRADGPGLARPSGRAGR